MVASYAWARIRVYCSDVPVIGGTTRMRHAICGRALGVCKLPAHLPHLEMVADVRGRVQDGCERCEQLSPCLLNVGAGANGIKYT